MATGEKVYFDAFWCCFSQIPTVQVQVGLHTILTHKTKIEYVQNALCLQFNFIVLSFLLFSNVSFHVPDL